MIYKKIGITIAFLMIINLYFIMDTSAVELETKNCVDQSVVDYMKYNIKLEDINGRQVITGLTNDYYVVIKNDEFASLSYATFRSSGYSIQQSGILEATDSDGSVKQYTTNSIVYNNGGTEHSSGSLDVTNLVYGDKYIYIYPIDALLTEGKVCNSMDISSVKINGIIQARPYKQISVLEKIDETSGTIDFEEQYKKWNDMYTKEFYYDWAKEFAKEKLNQNVEVNIAYDYINSSTITKPNTGSVPLTCETNQFIEETEIMYTGEVYPVEVTYTANGSTQTANVCNVSCVEKLEVTYGEPIALLAGMGFSYDVKVSSIVDCTSILNKDNIKKIFESTVKQETCTMYPSCNGGQYGDYNNTAAGPTDDFDDCVIACDGGKYTEECSAMCYDVVYNGEEVAQFQTNKLILEAPSFVNTSSIKSISDVRSCSQFETYYNGIIDEEEKKLVTNAYYYYCSPQKAASTNNRFASSYYGYILDPNGYNIKTAYIFRSINNGCDAVCEWRGTCPGGISVGAEEVKENNNNALSELQLALEECNTTSISLEEDTSSTYKLDIVNEYINSSGKIEKTFDSSEGEYLINNYKSYDKSILGENKGQPTENEITYQIPQSYVNFNGKVIYENENGDVDFGKDGKDSYRSTGNQFITSLSSVTTNKDWYRWRIDIERQSGDVNGDMQITAVDAMLAQQIAANVYSPTQEERNYADINLDGNVDNLDAELILSSVVNNGQLLIYTGDKVEYNIKTELSEVGNYDWLIDVDCFYALENDGPPPEIGGGGIHYVFRPIDLLNVFPNEDGDSDNLTANGRVPQWNWSAAAKETTVTGYVIDPIALTEKIEELGQDATYEEDPDYIITLDRQSISEIRDYNEKQGSYLNTEAECRPQDDGRSVCNLGITGSVFEGVIDINSKVGCNNSKSLSECEIVGGN